MINSKNADSAANAKDASNASDASDASDIGLWIFGYGSLIWRPAIAYSAAYWATASGWSRRFWQGSHDHRGTIESPGRVLTLVPIPGERCQGRLFGITHADVDQTLDKLDYREKNGYQRQQLTVWSEKLGSVQSLTYIAPLGNSAWLGEAELNVIAEQIRHSSGPSGSNKEYVLSLHSALESHGIHDKHIQDVASLLI